MRILHVLLSCPPAPPIGGADVYVASLARHQKHLGLEVQLAVPASVTEHAVQDGFDVWRFQVPDPQDLDQLYGLGNPTFLRAAEQLLASSGADLVHVHTWSAAARALLALARRVGLPAIYTWHSPSTSCLRGTLMRNGTTPCDGRLRRRTCSTCALQGKGLPGPVALALAGLPPAAGRIVAASGRSGRGWTALRTSELTAVEHAMIRRLVDGWASTIVVLSAWLLELLLRLGAPAAQVALIRSGVSDLPPPAVTRSAPRSFDGVRTGLQVAFVGRFAREKGADLLLGVLRARPGLAVEVHLYGSDHGEEAALRRMGDGDPRVHFHGSLPPAEVVPALAGYDVLAVPSRWMETGPLVVLEAFAAGIPVIGSDLGGIAELVRDGVDGLLLPMDSPPAWSAALGRLATDRQEVRRLAAGVRPPRTMAQVAAEMLPIYEAALAGARGPAS